MSQESFGLLNSVHLQSGDDHASEACVQDESKVPITQVDYQTVMKHTSDFDDGQELENMVEEDGMDLEFSQTEALSVLERAICSFFVTNKLKSLSKTAFIRGTDIFFISFLATVEGLPKADKSFEVASQHLNNVLQSWNFEIVTVEGDGNCLFSALSLAIIQRLQSSDSALSQILLALGLPLERMNDVASIAQLLRECMVKKWLENSDSYQGFTTTDIQQVAHTYLSHGEFAGDLGDLMVLTLANILNTPITLLTSVINMPVLCILPIQQASDSTLPLFLTYNQAGPGHYDYAVPSQHVTDTNAEERSKPTKCTCGRKPGFSGSACTTGRCPCVRNKSPCKSICCCKKCSNHLGERPQPSSTRRRDSYETRKQPLYGRAVEEFMRTRQESVLQGSLTLMEVMVLKATIIHFILNGLSVTENNVFYAYNKVIGVAQLVHIIDFTLHMLNKGKIERFLKRVCVTLELLRTVLLPK